MENAEKKIENAELLRSKAEQVANATQVGENTAQRIGDIFRLIADIISQMLNGGTEMSKTDKTQNEKIENIEKTLKTLQDSVASNNQNATNAEAIKSVKQLVERLQEQLNTIVGENATTAIDNFNEIKNFLAGLKDSDTLTALLAKVNERLIALERAKPSTDVLEVLEFDGFTDRAVAVQMESATGDFKVLFDAKNKRFVAKINGQNNYSAGWLSEGEATSTDSDYQARGSNPRPFAKKIYINRANNTSYRWNGEELVQINASNNALKPHINKLTRALEKPKLVENGEFQTAVYGIQAVRPTIGQPYVASAGLYNSQRIYIAVNESERILLKNTTDTDSKFCWTIDAQTKISNNTKLNQPEGENSTYDVPNNSELEVVAPKGAKFICIQSKNDGVACMPEVYKFVSRLDASEELEKQLSTKVEAFEGKLSEEKTQRAEANKALKKEIFSEIGEVKNKVIPIPTKKYPYLMHQRKVWAGYSSANHVYLPVEQGKTYLIKANSEYSTNYAFATEIVNSVNGQKVTGLSSIDGEVHEIEKASTIAVTPPEDANYLIVNITDGSSYEKTWSIAPIVEEKLTLVEALNAGENSLDIVALNGENEITNKLLQLRRHLNMNISGASGLMPVVLLWFSDIHSDKVQFKRIMQFYERYKTYINGILCTGDMVFDSLKDDYSYLGNDLKKLMMTLGNHDIARTAWNDQTVTAEEDYNIFIKPFVDAGLVDNSTVNKCYWYKDYPTQKLRLIGLDALHWDEAQKNWLETALNDAKNKGYSVVCANHFFGGRNRTHIECAFDNVQKLSEGDASINAEAPATIQKFIDKGGDFVCWLSGHTHRDYVYYLTDYPKQMGFTIDCATCSNGVTDEERENGTKSQDCFNLIAFDTTRKLVKIARIGSDRDSLLRKKDTICINYQTKKIYT
jgi:hypothetical protein|nr:MAG TPA: metallophosphatase domain protein [Caudoviricetes sp.]